jgi:hypothetical protein
MAEFIQDPQPLHPDYPLPGLDDAVVRPFWDGAREGKLVLQRDRETGVVHWPPKPAYWKGGRLEYFTASGRGTVYTYVVGLEPFLPAFQHLLPHIMVVVQLAEGTRIVGHMVRCTPDEMRFGMPVRVVFKRLTDRVTLPVWEPER